MTAPQTNTARVITVRLRVPALVLMALLLVGGLIWAFVLGVMVGREEINEELAALMPPRQQPAGQNEADKGADEVEKLIRVEDLKYQESLRQNQPQEAPRAPAPAPIAPRPAPAAVAAQPQGQSAGKAAYRYSYQVASYNKEEQARALAGKLGNMGVKAEVEAKSVEGASRFRVLIHFEGDDNTVESMQNMLKKDFKINSILPRGKTPLGG